MPKRENPEEEKLTLEAREVQPAVKDTPEKIRHNRLARIDAEMNSLYSRSASEEDEKIQREQEYQTKLSELEVLLGQPLSEETKRGIHVSLVEGAMNRAEKERQKLVELQTEKLHALLLTQDEEGLVMKKAGETAFKKKEFISPEGSVILIGTRHSWNAEEPDKVYKELTEVRPDVLMHEGKDIRDLFPNMTDQEIRSLDPASVLAGHQEQTYLAWKAFVDGIETKSWDIPMHEQFIRIMQLDDEQDHPKHTPEAIQSWFASAVMQKLYSKEMKPDVQTIGQVTPAVISPEEQILLREAGIDLEANNLLKAFEKLLGKTLEDLLARFDDPQLREKDHGMLRSLVEPRKSSGTMGPTNYVLADMNRIRDMHAIDVLNEEKKKHSKIAVTAGASHILTLEPAVQELYKDEKLST